MITVKAVTGRLSGATNRLFYAVVVGVSLTGAGQAAVGWLHWWAPFAFAAVAAVELGGVALSIHADTRRQLGERAVTARLLSAAIAAGAVAVNGLGHQSSPGQAAFFAGMSALGYCVWLIDSGARRRDALRASPGGMLAPTAPVYGIVAWLRHPWLTQRARSLALMDPKLGLYGSVAAARQQVRVERRQAALSSLLRKKIAQNRDPLAAEIAITVFDPDEIASRLAAGADYDALTALIAEELTPARVADTPTMINSASIVDSSEIAGPSALPRLYVPADEPRSIPVPPFPNAIGELLRDYHPTAPPAIEASPAPAKPRPANRQATPKKTGRPSAADEVAKAMRRKKDASPEWIASKIGRSVSTVKLHMKALAESTTDSAPETPAPINGARLT